MGITLVIGIVSRFLRSFSYKITKVCNQIGRGVSSNRIVAICTALILFLGAITYIHPPLPYSSDELVERGNNFYEKRDYQEAVKNYGRSLDIDKENGNAWRKKGFAYLNIGINNESLIINLTRAYSNARSLIEFYNSSDDSIIINQDAFENAYYSFDQTYKSNPKDFEALLYKGIASLYLSNSSGYNPISEFEEVVTVIDDTSSYRQDSPIVEIKYSAWYGKCVSYRKIGSKEKAEECFQSLFKLPEIKIIAPREGDKVSVSTMVSGTFSGKLPEERYMWVFVNPQITPSLWWPQGLRVEPKKGQWNMQVWIGNTTSNVDIAIILVNEKDDQYLWNYRRTGDKTGNYPGIPLPASATIMDKITVVQK
ncbi:hypothetical protein ANME2D_03415 [Candidatus Methanoperedens nitroreducens]|uniref:Uncharacterized protein n=1 Tax=Candidatus Methanoperedens nitratireducens TaxID=1392998 RepID=A0A062V399_9EURY|nr:tetratricopeptide repeat protein [Candidatus Methanoperedens nitroreducens]KCZ70299.1 hypothetical protein ANME2D_03415 [Candidatus Methanoperedens nitroreducens]MDJ1421337.1 tetratricopeptide repeat protein [Candidatus Methanoperedens sp.]